MNRSFLAFILALVLVVASLPALTGCVDDSDASETEARNIIFMVPDGMGLSNVTAARTYLGGPDGAGLSFESLPYIGYQRTHARNSYVTDSAAAASAWASGEKFNNGEISCLDDNEDGVCDPGQENAKTILELAQEMGMATGLVATSDITHATPAAFGAHAHNRKCESTIFEQMITKEIDVLLGGGAATNRSSCLLEETDDAYNEALIALAQSDHNYAYVTDKNAMATASTEMRLLGLFSDGGLTPQVEKSATSVEPSLTEMTEKALSVLEKDEDGFLLVVEGSQIDWANHARNLPYQIGETVDFDRSVEAVMDWLALDPERSKNTLLVVVADHETGGFVLTGPYGSQATAGDSETQFVLNTRSYTTGGEPGDPYTDMDGLPIMAPNEEGAFGSNYENYDASANHTAVDTVIWSNQPEFAKAMQNTDMYYLMQEFLGIEQ